MQKAYLDTLSIDYFKNKEKFLLDIFSSTLENLRKSENWPIDFAARYSADTEKVLFDWLVKNKHTKLLSLKKEQEERTSSIAAAYASKPN